eukprot:m.11628 g.11628  ORF g.11628 m.11628 type:complete len:569 (-) comp8907_c0_seq1:113-1819(-)
MKTTRVVAAVTMAMVSAILRASTTMALPTMQNRTSLTKRDEPGCSVMRQTSLTYDRLSELCPDFLTNPKVKLEYSMMCDGDPDLTIALKLSIANGMFGGAEGEARDCTAWCVKNSEGPGHFFFRNDNKCFKYKRADMCGTSVERDFVNTMEDLLCDHAVPNGLFRFHKMQGKPAPFSFPLTTAAATSFAPTTDAVSLRMFQNTQVQSAINPIAMAHMGGIPSTCFADLDAEIFSVSDEFYKATHADSADEIDRVNFWNEFREVIAVQQLREADMPTTTIFSPAQSIQQFIGAESKIADSAQSVQTDFPSDFPTRLLHYLNNANDGALDAKINKAIFNQCSYPGNEFVNGFVAIADMVGWAIREVSPAAFATKWHVGRARPEEVAWEIHSQVASGAHNGGAEFGGHAVPDDIVAAIAAMELEDRADFTAYKSVGAGGGGTFGYGGSPVHPSYPAMHSAASSSSTWMSVVFDLDPTEIDELRLMDFSVSYFRTMAGVHYRSDNKAGLALGQRVVKEKLPDFLAERYGCSAVTKQAIRDEVNRKLALHVDNFYWGDYLPTDFVLPTMEAPE